MVFLSCCFVSGSRSIPLVEGSTMKQRSALAISVMRYSYSASISVDISAAGEHLKLFSMVLRKELVVVVVVEG